jgi:hypothetical protein
MNSRRLMLNMGISSPSRFKRVSVVTALGRRNVTGAVFFTHIIRIEQSKGRKNRNVMLSPKMLDLLRQWWKVRPTRWDTGVPLEERWLFPGRKPGKPMTTRQLARLFRSKMLAMLLEAHDASQLTFFNTHAGLADKRTFKRFIAPLRRIRWVVYCKAPFAGPEQVLRYLSRYTHRVAISNHRLIAADDGAIAFRWKDYRVNGPRRWKTMRLHPHEFIRRFLMHVLPKGFRRIRHYGLFANANRAENIATPRALLNVTPPAADPQEPPDIATDTPRMLSCPCPHCGGRMIVIDTFAPGCEPRWRPMPSRIDTS